MQLCEKSEVRDHSSTKSLSRENEINAGPIPFGMNSITRDSSSVMTLTLP